MDEVEVDVEDDRDLRLPTDGRHGRQHLGGCGAGFQTALGGELVHHAVGQRIAERHAELEDVHASESNASASWRVASRLGSPAPI